MLEVSGPVQEVSVAFDCLDLGVVVVARQLLQSGLHLHHGRHGLGRSGGQGKHSPGGNGALSNCVRTCNFLQGDDIQLGLPWLDL